MGTSTPSEYYSFVLYIYDHYHENTPSMSAHRYNYLANVLLKLDLL